MFAQVDSDSLMYIPTIGRQLIPEKLFQATCKKAQWFNSSSIKLLPGGAVRHLLMQELWQLEEGEEGCSV